MSDKPVTHGIEHRPSSYDPSCTDPWTYVLDPIAAAPAWSSGTTYSAGSSGLPATPGDLATDGVFQYQCVQKNKNVEPGVHANWAQYWRIDRPIFQNGWSNQGGSLEQFSYRLSVGPPNVLDRNSNAIIDYSDHQVEIQGSVQGGVWGTVVFQLPPSHTPIRDKRLAASDDLGGFVPLTVKGGTGLVYKGLA